MGPMSFSINGALPFCSSHHQHPFSSLPPIIFKQGLQENENVRFVRPRSIIRVLANPNVSPRRGSSKNEVIMVDPLEAKCLAAKEMQEIKAKERFEVSPRKGSSKNEVMMVDPLVAKCLAAKEMQEIQAKERLKRQRLIESINGAWAMIGLTACLVIEGHSGNVFLAQLAGYWRALVGFFVR